MKSVDISNLSMALAFLLALIPLAVSIWMKLKLTGRIVIGIIRMAVQLGLIGLFLVYLFKYDNALLNVGWLMVMMAFAASSVISNSRLSIKAMALPVLFSVLIPTALVLVYYNLVILQLDNLFAAQYFIVIGGMILGNCLKSNIVSLNTFYNGIKNSENRYLLRLGLGGTVTEAVLPFAREALITALAPTVATMATMGIVAIPGMMTGQILGGSDPSVAVKYQITIMLAILATAVLSALLALVFSLPGALTPGGMLKRDIFR